MLKSWRNHPFKSKGRECSGLRDSPLSCGPGQVTSALWAHFLLKRQVTRMLLQRSRASSAVSAVPAPVTLTEMRNRETSVHRSGPRPVEAYCRHNSLVATPQREVGHISGPPCKASLTRELPLLLSPLGWTCPHQLTKLLTLFPSRGALSCLVARTCLCWPLACSR